MFEMKMNVFRIAINTAAIRLRRARFSPTFAPLSSSRFLNASRRAASNVCNAHRRVFACKSYPLSDLSFHNYPFRSFLSFFLFFLFLFFFFFLFISRSKDPWMHILTNEVRQDWNALLLEISIELFYL